jgi:hypothetical protein
MCAVDEAGSGPTVRIGSEFLKSARDRNEIFSTMILVIGRRRMGFPDAPVYNLFGKLIRGKGHVNEENQFDFDSGDVSPIHGPLLSFIFCPRRTGSRSGTLFSSFFYHACSSSWDNVLA